MAYDRDWWDSASEYFNNSDFNTEYYTPSERAEIFSAFSDMLRQVEMGLSPQDTLGWAELEAMGFNFNEDFDWDDFREWYDQQG